jgi:phytoene dehydrogenase-like protein
MILIVGAGLAGLSTAYHLSETPYRLYEREMEVGGLCRSYRKDGFTFDYTGHLLHFRQPQIKALVERGKLPTERIDDVIFGCGTKAVRGTSNRILASQRQPASTASRP